MDFECKKCGSEYIGVKTIEGKAKIYCKDCGAFIKNIDYKELNAVFRYMKRYGYDDGKTFKNISNRNGYSLLRCANCGCQLYRTGAPRPVGQFDLLDAKFCPQCGREFV